MRRAFSSTIWKRWAVSRWLVMALLGAAALPGCAEKKAEGEAKGAAEPLTVRLIKPDYRKIVRVVGQPSFVEAYERTSIYPKVTGYIEKWNVDIGDKVKKGDILATLFVPELVEDCETKHRVVKLDEEKVALAEVVVDVAKADVEAADARVKEAAAVVVKFRSDVDRWDSEVKRLQREVNRGVVDPQVLLESQNQHRMSEASWIASKASLLKADALLKSEKATLAKTIVDVEVKRRDVAVAESDAKRMDAWVGYLQLIAPFDGVITARNANTWDFVLPATGDPSTDPRTPHLSPGGKAAPIYLVDRTDIVRIFVDIPEADANYVQKGTKATVQVKGFRDRWIKGFVTRTSWALNFKSRTLRAEVDLENFDQQILPGMYAYGRVIIDRPNVRALPEAALVRSGDQTFYWRYEDGKAKRTEVQIGVSDGDWVEVTNRQEDPKAKGDDPWTPINGTEQVILGDLSLLTEGAEVRLAGAPAKSEEKKPAEAADHPAAKGE